MKIRQFFLVLAVIGMQSTAHQALAQQDPAAPEPPPSVRAAEDVIFDTVRERARSLAEQGYNAGTGATAETLAKLNYDQYRAIRFDPDRAVWRDQTLFEIQPFHPGFIFTSPVKINLVAREGAIRNLPFSTENFIYDKPAEFLTGQQFDLAGFSGFRVHYPMNTAGYKDEVLAFQGASYFRLLSIGQTFGLSARGVAVNTAEASGEEFPHFSEFWLLTPNTGDSEFYIFALLDSPSLTGAFRFLLTPGMPSELKVNAQMFARKDVTKLGIAPLTSMFLHGENSVKRPDDFRPEVHDSDGLLMHTQAGEWIWRALSNPPELRIVGLSDANPRGFGLMQRDDNFDHYQDIGAAYQARPGLWVAPEGDWGPGRVELVEIPTNSETNDNIVAYWVPENPLKKGNSLSINYSLTSVGGDFGAPGLAQVTRTGNSWAALPGSSENLDPRSRRFLVDFTGVAINQLAEDIPLDAEINSSAGKVSDINIIKVPGQRGWRVSFRLDSSDKEVVDLRLYLTLRGKRISEVWNYVWSSKSLN